MKFYSTSSPRAASCPSARLPSAPRIYIMSWTATFSRRLLAAGIVNCVIAGLQASAQQPVYEKEEAIPVSPAKSPGPMTLDQCLELGFQHQPALDAARASLNAAAV